MKSFVEIVATNLQTGAQFIMHSGMLAESILPNYSNKLSFEVDTLTMDITHAYHAEDSRLLSYIWYTKGGKTEDHAFKHYVFTLLEVKRLLSHGGLTNIAAYNSPTKSQYQMGNPQIYLVVQKQ